MGTKCRFERCSLRFELYRRSGDSQRRWRVSSTLLGGRTVYWLSVWTPRWSLRVFPRSMEWSNGDA
jgi:hypothetical protein